MLFCMDCAPNEMAHLKPILRDRKNFSMVVIDWWNSPWWYAHHAEYLIFNLYNGIDVHSGAAQFANGWNPPLFSKPELMIPFHLAGSALRPLALLSSPFRDLCKTLRRRSDNPNTKTTALFSHFG